MSDGALGDVPAMTVHLVNPSHLSFGVDVITPRWLFVLAGATPSSYGRPRITDETLESLDIQSVQPGDVVGIGIHTGKALRGYEIGTLARHRGATVIFGGIHATLYPDEAQSLGGAHAVVKGDGDVAWPRVLEQLRALRAERFALMDRLADLPTDMVFFTQITMEAAEDTAFLDAMRRANIKGALVGVEAVTPEGLKDVYKSFNDVGEALIARLRTFRAHGVHVLGSFIFGLPSDRPSTFRATVDVANRAELAFAQFVMLTPYPGTVDFEAWEKRLGPDAAHVGGVPITRHWLIPRSNAPRCTLRTR
jgi:radical SAM superfamily enzyme YgiQ (UPF0313 family)